MIILVHNACVVGLRMLSLWIFLFLTSGALSKYAKEDDYRCTIPPSDVVKNANFSVYDWMGETWVGKDQPPAGTKLLTYDLEFQCDPGYFLRGNQYVRCVPFQVDDFPECSDTCEPSDPDCPVQSDGISTNVNSLTDSDGIECGTVTVAPTALAGGRTAIPGDVPWQAAVYDKTTSPFMQICGGSIVSKDVVISAAHCFKLPDEFYAVAVGKIYRPYNNPMDGHAQKSDVLEIRIPPRYRGSVTSFQDDIAALILATPIEFTRVIRPVCLHFGADFDEVQLTPGTLGRVAGWGIDSQNGRPSQVLNLAQMPMVDVGTCFMLQDVSFIQYITSDKFCAGYTNGTSLCKGDSGGGLAVPHKSGFITRYYLRGVVSTGPPPSTLNECNVNAVTTFTRVARHEYFVKSAIAKKPLQESERRIPSIIPASFINSNQNRIANNGVNEGVPLKVDPVNQINLFTNERPIFGNGGTLQKGAPGSVVVISDTFTTDGDRNTQIPLRDNPVQTNNVTNEKPLIGNFLNSRDPQANAPGTVVVIPDTLTINEEENTQIPLRDDPVQTNSFINERPLSDSFLNSRDPQASSPGTVVVIPDTLTTNEDGNTEIPLRDNPVQTNSFISERPISGRFPNSRDPQANAPGTVVVIPDTLTTNGNGITQIPLKDNPVQTNSFISERPISGSFPNSRDPQANAPGTVVVIPDTLTTNGNGITQIPPTDNSVQTNSFINNETPKIGNSRDPQADAPSTAVVIPNTLVIDVNRNTEDPLREDAVQPVGIFDNQRPVSDSSLELNSTVANNSESLMTTGNKNDESPVKDSFIPKPIAGLNDDGEDFTDLNTDSKPPLVSTHRPTFPLTDKNQIIPEELLTTPNPQLNQGAPGFNYQNWPYFPQTPYQYKPNQNWHYPSQNVPYPNQNGNYPSHNVHYPNQGGHYPSQNGHYPSHNGPKTPYNVENNGHFGNDWHYNNPVWNSYNHHGSWWHK